MKIDKPIATSLLDNDLYKLKMCMFAWKLGHIGETQVTYEFQDRASTNILSIIDINELREQIEELFNLSFRFEELLYLRSIGYPTDFLDFLSRRTSISHLVNIRECLGRLTLNFSGPWNHTVLYEVPIMYIITEMYNTAMTKFLSTEGRMTLENNKKDKIDITIERIKYNRIKFVEYGTRRRFSKSHHRNMVQDLASRIPSNLMLGTSNLLWAKENNIKAFGTMAHEVPMFFAAYFHDRKTLANTNNIALANWKSVFGTLKDTLWLTDTFGTKHFLKNVKTEYLEELKGLRQDSGDPIEVINSYINEYKTRGIDYTQKTIMASDGMTMAKIIPLLELNPVIGWGTYLSNNTIIKPLSIVIKLSKVISESNIWIETAKLSDNPEKHFGEESIVNNYKQVFNYKE